MSETAEQLDGTSLGHLVTVRSHESLPPIDVFGGPVWAVRGLLAEVAHRHTGVDAVVTITVLVGTDRQRVTIDVLPRTFVQFHGPTTNV